MCTHMSLLVFSAAAVDADDKDNTINLVLVASVAGGMGLVIVVLVIVACYFKRRYICNLITLLSIIAYGFLIHKSCMMKDKKVNVWHCSHVRKFQFINSQIICAVV